jgi:hypothetical protein
LRRRATAVLRGMIATALGATRARDRTRLIEPRRPGRLSLSLRRSAFVKKAVRSSSLRRALSGSFARLARALRPRAPPRCAGWLRLLRRSRWSFEGLEHRRRCDPRRRNTSRRQSCGDVGADASPRLDDHVVEVRLLRLRANAGDMSERNGQSAAHRAQLVPSVDVNDEVFACELDRDHVRTPFVRE